jgi:hypothetical protein
MLKVNPDLVALLLALPEYKHINTQTLCVRALQRLVACRFMPFPVTDRALAIAILGGVSLPGHAKTYTVPCQPDNGFTANGYAVRG